MNPGPPRDDRVEIVERTTPFRGFFRIDIYRLRHRKFDGGWTRVLSRELFERGHAAAILPYDPVRDTVVLIEQFRLGAFAAGLDPWLIEVAAGIIEAGEEPEAVARREVVEECGCRVEAVLPIGRFIMSPGGSSECLHIFCGRVDSDGLGGIHGLPHEGEDIRVSVVAAEDAFAQVANGGIPNATSVIALQWLQLNRPRLRSEWQ